MNSMRDQLAVAIDFGTTFSGVAYMPLQNINNGFSVLQPVQLGGWPGQPPNINSYKCPTAVAYPSNGGSPLWGFEADRPPQGEWGITYHRVKAFKTFLEPDKTPQFEGPPGKMLKDVVHDYLEGVYQHLIMTLATEGLSTHEVDYQVLFTVPAPFSNAAVECFRRIVQTTGFGNHFFDVSLTEPEAAAVYTIATQQPIIRRTSPFQTQQCFLVCDAGGGTVDISSYSITQLHPRIRVEQIGEVDGDLCGSTFVDRNFQVYLKGLLGAPTISALTKAEKDDMMDQFVGQKERFTNMENSNIRLPRHDLACPGKKGDYLPITPDKMREFFEGPVARTCQMVCDTILKCGHRGFHINFVFLVGGFGTSPYLKVRLEDALRQVRMGPPILVIKPADAQQSVVLGTLSTQMQRLKRDEDPVSARLCRAYYGLLSMKPFDPTIHYPHERFVHPVTKHVMAKDQIVWLINKGDRITNGAAATVDKNLVRMFKRVTIPWTETLVRYAGDNPPTRMAPGVEEVCKMSSDLRRCQPTEFDKKKRKSEKWCGMGSETYYEAMYTVRMLVGTADVKFEMWYKGRLRTADMLTVAWDKLGDAVVS